MVYVVGNKFIKFLMVDKDSLDINLLKNSLGSYLEIIECNSNDVSNIDLTIVFMKKEEVLYKDGNLIVDNHITFLENNTLYVYLDDCVCNEMVFVKRLLTDLSNRFFERKNGIFLHASSIVDDNNAIVFVGEKGSGKTTNMLYILDSENVAYSSNERTGIILDKASGNLITYGNPARINIRANSLKQCKSVREKLKGCIDQEQFLAYSEMNLANNCSERLVVSFNDIYNNLLRDIVPSASLQAVCNLVYSSSIDFMVEEVDYFTFRESIYKSIIDGVFPVRDVLNDMFPAVRIDIDDLFMDKDVKFYNIYQNFKVNNSSEMMRVLRRGYNDETNR